jgi:hypothetical protein
MAEPETVERLLVRMALERALEGGYEEWIRTTTDDAIAFDLVCHESTLEDSDSDRLLPHVTEWKREQLGL